MTELYHSGLGYSGLNTARCALSTFLQFDNNISIGSHPLVKRFFKGVFILRPALPRYNVTWDVNTVLTYLKELAPLHSLTLLQLSQKLLMLLALLSGQRGQTMHMIDIRNLHICDNSVKIIMGDLLKSSKPGKHLAEINLSSFHVDKDLCVVEVCKYYLERTKQLRGQVTNLFISTQRPHKAVSRDTISRWLKCVMKDSGIDTSIFKPHSVRSASTSMAKSLNIPISTILRTAGWNKDCVFRKFYNKPIIMDKSYSQKMLEQFK